MPKKHWNKKPRITRICPCGTEFTFGEGELARRNPTYCSNECRRKYFAGRGSYKHILPHGTDDLIRKAYQEEVGMQSCTQGHSPVRDLAKTLGVPRWKVTRRAQGLGLITKKKKEPSWTEKELKILESQSRFTPETIQRKLKENGYARSVVGIVLKRQRMRFLGNLNGQTANNLSACFGIDRKTITRWINKGYLKAQKRNTNRTSAQGGDAYYIKDRWVRDFIIESIDMIDIRKVDKYWLIDLLAGGEIGTGPRIKETRQNKQL